jgi:prepilin-type N-terminal cleavage/methylation domain-containing protein
VNASLERLRQRRKEEGHEGGFTLIELLIVVVVLGILAAIVVFAVGAVTGKSANASCQSDFKVVQTAEEAYKAQMAVYDGTLTDLTTTTTDAQGFTVGPWIKSVPTSSHYGIAVATATGAITVTPTQTGGVPVTATDANTACAGVTK